MVGDPVYYDPSGDYTPTDGGRTVITVAGSPDPVYYDPSEDDSMTQPGEPGEVDGGETQRTVAGSPDPVYYDPSEDDSTTQPGEPGEVDGGETQRTVAGSPDPVYYDPSEDDSTTQPGDVDDGGDPQTDDNQPGQPTEPSTPSATGDQPQDHDGRTGNQQPTTQGPQLMAHVTPGVSTAGARTTSQDHATLPQTGEHTDNELIAAGVGLTIMEAMAAFAVAKKRRDDEALY